LKTGAEEQALALFVLVKEQKRLGAGNGLTLVMAIKVFKK
jgi:hypothetical protein